MVIKRSVDVGQTVAASLQAPELFIIARDLRDMQVETSIDEADVGRIHTGQRATFTVDAFPGRAYAGEVRQVRKSAQNVQNVVTYTVLVSAANPDGQLMPGMTANVRIVTDTRESVLKIANAALRFRPPGESAPAGDGKAVAEAPPAGGAGSGQLQQFRQRLIAELKLDDDQQARVGAIFDQLRGRFMSLRELPEDARAKAASTVRAEMRASIEEILKPEQKPRYAELLAELASSRGGQSGRGRIWVPVDGKPKAIEVRTGLTDGTATEIIGAGVQEGLEVITGIQSAASAAPAAKGGAPRMFF